MRTIWLEFTKRFWFPPVVDRTLFGTVLRLGWVGLGFSPHNLSEWVKAWRDALENAKRGSSGGKGQQK